MLEWRKSGKDTAEDCPGIVLHRSLFKLWINFAILVTQ